MNIIKLNSECYSFTDDSGTPFPALETAGCGCCRRYLPVTQENIDKAISEAKSWIAELEAMKPVGYPSEVEINCN